MLTWLTLAGRELTLLARVSILALASILIRFDITRDEAQATVLTCSPAHWTAALLTNMRFIAACSIVEFKACAKERAGGIDALTLGRARVLDLGTFVNVLCTIGAGPALWTLTFIEVVLEELRGFFVDA